MNPNSQDIPKWHLVLCAGSWYASLPQPFQHSLLDMATAKRYPTRQCLFRQGASTQGLWAIIEGSVSVSNIGGSSLDPRENTFTVLKSPAWFGEIAVFDNRNGAQDVYVNPGSLLLNISTQKMSQYLDENPAYWQDLGRSLADKLRLMLWTINFFKNLSPQSRLANALLSVAGGMNGPDQLDAKDNFLPLHISQEELAQIWGMTRQSTNLTLKALETKRLIAIKRGIIELVDIPRLKRLGSGLE